MVVLLDERDSHGIGSRSCFGRRGCFGHDGGGVRGVEGEEKKWTTRKGALNSGGICLRRESLVARNWSFKTLNSVEVRNPRFHKGLQTQFNSFQTPVEFQPICRILNRSGTLSCPRFFHKLPGKTVPGRGKVTVTPRKVPTHPRPCTSGLGKSTASPTLLPNPPCSAMPS